MRRYALGLASVALIAAALATYDRQRSGDEPVDRTAQVASKRVKITKAREPAAEWPTYGFDARRTRFAPGIDVRPPLRRIWTFRGRALLEFPPALAQGRLFLPTFDGRLFALQASSGKTLWRYDSGRCGWASPAVADGLVFVTFLNQSSNCNARSTSLGGEVVAFKTTSGAVRWRRQLGPTESSPLFVRGRIYVGDWLGKVYSLDAATGHVVWSRATDGAVKGSLAAEGRRVYVGSYDGHVYAYDARTGHELWRTGRSTGTFYSTPAVVGGRLYIGSTDGNVYAFDAKRGTQLWSFRTGRYVYASPAVWRSRVLIGSYDGSFYALDAATGEVRWRFRANGPISGSATVIASVVYFSTFGERTYALDASTGRLLWTWPDGMYSPVVAGDDRLYLVGRLRLYGMVEA